MTGPRDIAYVRTEDSPMLAAPPYAIGVNGWLLNNLVTNWWVALLAGFFAVLAVSWLWGIFSWGFLDAVFVADNREGCIAGADEGRPLGACWAYVRAKFGQWIYGFYPIALRWRPNLVFLLFFALLVPLLTPKAPWKGLNAILFFVVFPVLSFYLLYGTPIPFAGIGLAAWLMKSVILFVASIIAALGTVLDTLLAVAVEGKFFGWLFGWFSEPFRWIAWAIERISVTIGGVLGSPAGFWLDYLLSAGLIFGVLAWRSARKVLEWRRSLFTGLGVAAALAVFILLSGIDEGLPVVETQQWGGLLVTMVVAVTGIVASLPIGILLALGRRSRMPAIRLICITFIEMVRGVPLITVLFMASVMLPLFLPEGTNFDKLLRTLVGVALFSAAYMAEVVRGGLQAISKGQYEAASALGLNYWKLMVLVVLPQALKIVIPGIVNTFIGLFKDTTLVSIVGLFDLLGIVQAGFADQKWVSPVTAPTGYFGAAFIFFVFCFAMSRYSMYMERRLATGYRR
ncbi:MAG: amino acid ABC transporter permease [Pseudomonadota bacterium]|nr:amino acid ABC transporter permease [Pseudomonadota bacterium]